MFGINLWFSLCRRYLGLMRCRVLCLAIINSRDDAVVSGFCFFTAIATRLQVLMVVSGFYDSSNSLIRAVCGGLEWCKGIFDTEVPAGQRSL
ncbi:hypothetical Protein YC6258_04320 [Gynuella sunshinyii YC6258]|uniref:Uncharacterized protein n=1 Tax=Gynuella sunshinyii YC6258 TaxID=1445510 RepID=A0A0C5W0Z3_9GAMM|nr:hypothetical Protein YC6258_04320 [Gynuella sunshinyii YC6258]